jgi:hypothetical protein
MRNKMKIDATTQTPFIGTLKITECDGKLTLGVDPYSPNKEIDHYEYNSNVVCLSNPPNYTVHTIYKDGTKDVSYPSCLSHYMNSGKLIDLCTPRPPLYFTGTTGTINVETIQRGIKNSYFYANA